MIGPRTKLSIALAIAAFSMGCISTANVSDFARASSEVNFGEIEQSRYGHFEHEFTIVGVSKEDFSSAVREALDREGFKISFESPDEPTFVAERGLRANEWNSVVGVYSRREEDTLHVKIIYHITQDFTGGWTQHYAENVGIRIQSVLSEVN